MKRFTLLFSAFFLTSCAGTYNFAWFSINPFHPQGSSNIEFLIGGLWTTIWISLVSLILAAILGLIVTLPNFSSKKSIRSINLIYVEIFRALGVLILIYLFGFADETLLPSIIMTLHALINLIVSFGILFSYQRRLLIKPINN